MNLVKFLQELSTKNVQLWVDNGKLRYRGSEDVLTPALLSEIKHYKEEIILFLQERAETGKNYPLYPIARNGELPMSLAQQRLWFLYQLEPDSAFYNISAVVRFHGQLNPTALEYSLNKIIERHEALRTNFITVDGQPTQVIHLESSWKLPIVDLGKLPESEREISCQQLATTEAQQPFNLASDSLIRTTLLKLGETEHLLLLTIHHIVSDGWSMGVLVRELTALYKAYGDRLPAQLPELPIQYADFAHCQRLWLEGKVRSSQLAYWKEQLEGAPALLELPTDRVRPIMQTFRGAHYSIAIPPELRAALNILSQRQGVTLFMTLLAAFQTLLYRYTGQDDVCVGTPIANRNRPEIEGLIGFFVNTLVLRTDLSGNPSFPQLLSRVRQVTLGAYAHQDTPFEQLVEELQPARSLSHTPLFQVMFVLQNAPLPSLELPGLTVKPSTAESLTAKFDLTVSLENTEKGLVAGWEYNTDLFDAARIEGMAEHFLTLLQAIVANPEQKISQIPLLSAAEQHQILFDWNHTQTDYPKNLCLHSLFEEQVEKTPDAVAVVFEDQILRYQELNARANQLAHYLRSLGVGAEVLVGICVERSLSMVVGLLGILKAGGAYVPLDPEYPQDRLSFMLSDSGVKVLLTESKLVARLGEHQGSVVCLDTDWQTIASENTEPLRSNTQPQHLAYVIYTSGSTGKPKGAMNTHDSVCNRLLWMQEAYVLTPADSVLQKTPFSFDVSVWEFFWPLITGARLVVAKPGGHRDSAYLVEAIAQHQITTLHFVPSMLQVFLEEQDLATCSGLRQVFCSGEALPKELQERFFERMECSLHNLYGPTEAAIDVTFWQCHPHSQRRIVPIGQPIANTQIYIFDRDYQPVPVGVSGELYIGGVGVARGYLHRADLTAEKFIPHPTSDNPGERLYKTGDLARYTSDGNIEYLGRLDYQVKVRGFRIELGEIEAVLAQHPNVRETVVIATQEETGNQRLVAYIVPHQQPVPNISEWRSFLMQQLPEYMVPSAFVILDALPLTPNGKVDRLALPAPDAPLSTQNFVAPRTATEEMLAGIWASILQLESVGIHDNFFELGGHSLLATQLISRLRSTFGVDLPLRSLFEQPTVEKFGEYIGKASLEGTQQIPPIQPVPRLEEMPLSFAQARLWFLSQLEANSGFYNMPVAVRFDGSLNVVALTESLNHIISRHEALRTNFVTRNGQPVSLIASSVELTLSIEDLQQYAETERVSVCQQIAVAQAMQPFELATEPLIRALLLQLQPEEHVLLLTMHHIVSDGWSMGILVKELAAAYKAYCNFEPPVLAELPIQYADYAHWQQQWLQGEVKAQQLAYWTGQLSGAPALLELPTERSRPAVQTFQGAHQTFTVAPELSKALHRLSQQQGVTLFMTLLAAFQTLLYRYSGQTDISVGTPIANRHHGETEGLIGLFVNTLVLRTHLSGNPSFADLLMQVRETALGAYAHQDLPFEQLVEALQPVRSLSHTPLFQVMFVLQNAPMPSLELPGLTVKPLSVENTTAKFDLTITMENTALGLIGAIEYNTDLFDQTTITRMVGHFQTILASVVEDVNQTVSSLPILSAVERHQLLIEWNDTQTDYAKQLCIHSLFEQQVEKTPNAVALMCANQTLTYRELNARANQLAHYLRSLGVGSEVLVGVCMERSLFMVVALLGILKAGGAYVPLDPTYPVERLAYTMADACAEVLVTQQSLTNVLTTGTSKLVCLDTDWTEIAHHSQDNPVSEVKPDNLAYVIYTSGSTGRPKGVAIQHQSPVALVEWATTVFTPVELAGVLFSTSICFDLSVFELFVPLSCGGKVIIAENALHLLDLPEVNNVTLINTVPSAIAELLRMDAVPASVSTVNLAGEALPNQLVQQIYQHNQIQKVFNLYGPSEDTTYSTFALALKGNSQEPPIGRPIANTQIYILDADAQPVPIGVSGELHISGVGLARGYLNQPELTNQRFIPNPFSPEPGSRLYKTGDLARYLPDGNIEYLGRIDHQVKVRGFRIELGEIESRIAIHPNVRQTVVVARSEEGNQRLVAYIVPHQQPVPSISEWRSFLTQQLPEYMVPSAFVILEALPLTPNGKVDRLALPAPDAPLSTQDFVAPRTATEEMLAGIWASILQLESVGIHDNFFELGGHSLLATQLISRLRSTFGVDLPLRSLFEQPTIGEFGEYIGIACLEGTQQIPPIQPVPRLEEMPLSFAQARLWFLSQLEANSGFYNMPVAVRFDGSLNVVALTESLNHIISRHEALRTNFVTRNGQPVSLIASSVELTLSIEDLQQYAETERVSVCQQIAVAQAMQPFELATEPLIRALLLQLQPEEHVLLLTMHHIVSDGWSMGILVKELAAAYKAYCNFEPPVLAELPIQYADYAHWQQQWLQGEVKAQQLAYWTGQLSGAPALLELPTERSRPAVQTFQGAHQTFTVAPELSKALHRLSQQQGVTLFMTLLAAFQTLLYRYSGQTDICVGTPIANRHHGETEGLIGLFVNTLVLRTHLSGNPSFADLLVQVRETALGAYAHQDLPFEQLVEALQPVRSLSHTPLFQVMFVLQNAPMPELELDGLRLNLLPVENVTAKFDILLSAENTFEGLALSWEYNTDLFNAATIMQMAEHFQTVLAGIVANPEQRLSDLPLLTAVEQQKLLVEWNNTKADTPQNVCVHQLFEAQVEKTPDAVAVVFENQILKYRELNARANQLAHYLRSLGVGSEVLVGVCMERSLSMVVALLGILKAGGAYVPLDPAYPQERLSLMLKDSQVSILLSQHPVSGMAEHGAQMVCIDRDWETIAQYKIDNPKSNATPDNLAYAIYTSGSTGIPKAVLGLHRGIINRLNWMWKTYPFTNEEVCCQKTSLSFVDSVWEIFGSLLQGIKTVIIPNTVVKELETFLETLNSNHISRLVLVPSLLRVLLEADSNLQKRLPQLKLWVTSGEALPIDLLQKFRQLMPNSILLNLYGSSEVSADVTCYNTSWEDKVPERVSIGRSIANTHIYILDAYLQPVPIGVKGELYIGGEGLARGYLYLPELTAKQFVPNPFSDNPGERLYKTGDLARYLPDSNIEYLGRIDHQVKVRGFRIELGEIEAVLSQHVGVQQAVVLIREDEPSHSRIVAYIVSYPELTLTSSDLRHFLTEKLPDYMIPAAFVILDTLPLLPNGKVDRRALPAPDGERSPQETIFVAPQTPIEEKLAEIWTAALGTKQVGIYDNFFALGGHSLMAMQLKSQICSSFRVELSLQDLFISPTINSLAEKVEEALLFNSSSDDIDAMLDQLEGIDEDELQKMLTLEGRLDLI